MLGELLQKAKAQHAESVDPARLLGVKIHAVPVSLSFVVQLPQCALKICAPTSRGSIPTTGAKCFAQSLILLQRDKLTAGPLGVNKQV
jgi:hypothetical protein